MAIIDSLLSIIRDWKNTREKERIQIASYLRRISTICLEFREALERIRMNNSKEKYPFNDFHILEGQTALIHEYFKRLSSVLGGKVKSELLDEVAVYIARIYVTDGSLLFHTALDLKEVQSRAEEAWNKFPKYAIQLVHNMEIIGAANIKHWMRLPLDDLPPSIDDSLSQLSILSAKIQALADAIESGAKVK